MSEDSYYVCHTCPFKDFFAATWHTTEIYYIPLFVRYFKTSCVRVAVKVDRFDVRVSIEQHLTDLTKFYLLDNIYFLHCSNVFG